MNTGGRRGRKEGAIMSWIGGERVEEVGGDEMAI